MKRLFIIFLSSFLSLHVFSQESFLVRTETRYWDVTKAYNGYTLFGTRGTTYLVDMEGHVVHSWPIGTNPRFTESGTLLDAVGGNPSNQNSWKELDWDGNVVWSYSEPRSNYHGHHDFVKIFNPKLGDTTFIFIANKDLTSAECLAAGCDSTVTYTNPQMDALVEVNRQGKVIWEWWFFNHVVQDKYPSKPNYGVVASTPGKINLNMRGNSVKSDWLHCNSLDYNQELDQIVVNSVHGEFYVIDHGNTFVANDSAASIALAASSAGDFLYRFGDPAKYDQGDPPLVATNWEICSAGHKQLGGAHDIQWIKPGLPGAGHFLVFCNAQNLCEPTPQSYIYEINPYLDSNGINTGHYVNPPDASYNIISSPSPDLMKVAKNQSKQVVWKYSSKNNISMFSTIGSSAQRLPNGNTLICAMNDGLFFEVDSVNKSVVWEYSNPMTRDGIKKIIMDNYPTYNGVFRAYRYDSTEPALNGQNLTPGNTMTGSIPDYWTPSDITSSINDYSYENKQGNLSARNYPNPFSNTTNIEFSITEAKNIHIEVFNFSGLHVKKLADMSYAPGTYTVCWDATNDNGSPVSGGIYIYIVKANNMIVSKKMILIK